MVVLWCDLLVGSVVYVKDEWLWVIGRVDSPLCRCGPVIQNAAHILKCELVQGAEKRSAEDREFSIVVSRFQ